MNLTTKKFKIFLVSLAIIGIVFVLFFRQIGDFVGERIFIAKYSQTKDFWITYSVIKENKEFIRKNSNNDSAYDSLGQGYYALQAYDYAAGAFKRATEISPKHVDYWSFLGRTYQAMKDYQRARDAFTEVLKLDPDRPDNYTKLAWLYYFRLDLEKDKAFEVLKQGLEKFPNDKNILFDITRFYLYDENKKEFLKYAPRYLKIDPNQELIKNKYKEWK